VLTDTLKFRGVLVSYGRFVEIGALVVGRQIGVLRTYPTSGARVSIVFFRCRDPPISMGCSVSSVRSDVPNVSTNIPTTSGV
jgi:hypothetical protein